MMERRAVAAGDPGPRTSVGVTLPAVPTPVGRRLPLLRRLRDRVEPPVECIEVPRVEARDFRPPLLGGEPRVVLHNVDDWQALRRWDLRYLKEMAGTTEVMVREILGAPRNVYQNMTDLGMTSFAAYIDWVDETSRRDDVAAIARQQASVPAIIRAVSEVGFERAYYLNTKLQTLSERLFRDIVVPSWYATPPLETLLWCGVLGTSSGLHFDVLPNCNVQVVGRKHFILFPPSQSRRLYRFPRGGHCQFDPHVPTFAHFPRARAVRGWQCTLEPGESLYIPVGWFHQVTAMSPWSLNVNFFWPRPMLEGLAVPQLWDVVLRQEWRKFRRRFRRRGPAVN